MYETFFNFKSRPFASAPQAKNYFPAAAIEAARQTLERLIRRGEGPGLIIGPPGTGKTLLCHLLAERFKGPFAVSLLAGGRLKSCQVMLQAILYELGVPCRGLDEGELRLALMDYLEPKPDGPEALLLLVDEAHTLSYRLLDEVRLISNLVRDGQPRVRVVLSGGPVLEERFASPKLGSFAQRVAGRCYLEALDSTETAAYVRAQISAAGADPAHLLDDATLRNIYRATDGIPRLINQVCDHALVLASLGGHKQLSGEAIDEAWADLQQLPAPWSGATIADPAAVDVVEFGALDEGDELPEAIPFRSQAARTAQPLDAAEPEEQLDAIAEQLAHIEDPTADAPSTSAEVTLDFPEFGDPFTEHFAEEEVVLDPYQSGVEILADVPRVSSWEGHQLGALLEPLDVAEPWHKWAEPGHVRISQPPAEEAASASQLSHGEPVAPPSMPADEVAAAGPPVPDTTKEAPPAEPATTDEPAAEVRPRPLDDAAPSEPDVIVVEDEPATFRLSDVRPARREFRQLFSKLRRG